MIFFKVHQRYSLLCSLCSKHREVFGFSIYLSTKNVTNLIGHRVLICLKNEKRESLLRILFTAVVTEILHLTLWFIELYLDRANALFNFTLC